MIYKNGIIITISLVILGIHTSAQANNQAYCDNVWPGTTWNGRTCTHESAPNSKYLGNQNSSGYRAPSTIISSRTVIRTDGHAYCNNVWPRTRWNGVSCDRNRKLDLTISGSSAGGGRYSSGSFTIGGTISN